MSSDDEPLVLGALRNVALRLTECEPVGATKIHSSGTVPLTVPATPGALIEANREPPLDRSGPRSEFQTQHAEKTVGWLWKLHPMGQVRIHQNWDESGQFHQKILIKTTFVKNHFHQKPFSSKTTFIKNHFHQKTPNSEDLDHEPQTPNPNTLWTLKRPAETPKVGFFRVCVKASRAFGPQRFHTNTDCVVFARVVGPSDRKCSDELVF